MNIINNADYKYSRCAWSSAHGRSNRWVFIKTQDNGVDVYSKVYTEEGKLLSTDATKNQDIYLIGFSNFLPFTLQFIFQ